jgi:alanyl-tRNA synthetase
MAGHLIPMMSDEYNELERAKDLITETIINEEEKFESMLSKGMKIIKDEMKNIKDKTLKGEIAFKLYDTYGFPLDLTQDYFKPLDITVDTKKFNQLMEKRKEEARKSWKGSGSDKIENIWYELKDKFGATEFVGYNLEKTEAKIISIIKDGKEYKNPKKNDTVVLLTNQTCFYAEAGGQVGDSGTIKTESGVFKVEDTQKFFGSLFVHIGVLINGEIEISQDSILEVDRSRRANIKSNHSATHLLHAALREELGNHVAQRGSYVGPDRLRFDFSHSKQINQTELNKINNRVNYFIKQDSKVTTRLMSPDKAIKKGAMALFGEKYGDEVRVISMGHDNAKIFSLELCGGTHVDTTSKIGEFSIINESSISSGVRRIEALRGEELKLFLKNKNTASQEKIQNNQNKLQEIVNLIKDLNGDTKKFEKFENEKQINDAQNLLNKLRAKNILSDESKNIINSTIKDNTTITNQILLGLPAKEIRNLIDQNTKNNKNSIILVASLENKKTSIGVGVSEDLLNKYDAVHIVKKISSLLGSEGGGGRKDFAQSGGSETTLENIKNIFDKVIKEI